MSLLEDLISAITALAGLTAYDGNIYKSSEIPGDVLITLQTKIILLKGVSKDEVSRPFRLKLYAKDQTTQDTFVGLIKGVTHRVAKTDGYWEIEDETTDYTDTRRNLVLLGRQVKVE